VDTSGERIVITVTKGTSLYETLYRFSPSETRTQLENFLTESLCDLLRRLACVDRGAFEDFVCTILLGSHRSASLIRKQLQSARGFDWQTRRKVTWEKTYGFPDICIVSDSGDVILAVENKIAARFTTHRVEENTVTTDVPQLLVYDKWLSTKFPSAALVLLTHIREAPAGFMGDVAALGNQSPYKVKVRNTCRWLAVSSWFSQWHQAKSTSQSDEFVELRLLVREFLKFLEGINMSLKELETADLHTLTRFLEQDIFKTLQQVMESGRNVADHLIPRVAKQPTPIPYPGAWKQTQILWDWAYCYEKKLRWYIGWGFAGKNGLKDVGAVFQEPLQAFVFLGSEESDIALSDNQWEAASQQGWLLTLADPAKSSKGAVKSINVSVLTNADGFNESFLRWLGDTIKESLRIMEPAYKRVKQTRKRRRGN
jgi:hypothetical protein